MPNLFRFDSTQRFNRGKQLTHVRVDGTPSRSGKLGDVEIYPFIYIGERKQLSAADMGGPFLFSRKFNTQEREWWETTIVADDPKDVGGESI